ncbi:MAG TPA: prenyltransferase [Candidatus Saccharimonadales bacterium]|jgi:4-hydroxybenzoate polyprenyltransferase
MNLILQLLKVSRPISWLNTAYPFAATYLVLERAVDTRFVIATLFFLIPYNLIMYGVNDVYDYESDIRNPRKGGMEGALSAKRLHRPILIASAVVGIPFMVGLFVLGSLAANLVLAVVMFFVLAYSVPVLRFKERPFVDSITSSIHFVGPLIYGLTLAGHTSSAYALVASFFLWGMASHAFGAVQDIVPDREGGIRSIATALGASKTVWFSLGLYAASSLLLLTYGMSVALYAVVGLLYIINIFPFRAVSDADSHRSNKAWRQFIYLNLFAGFAATMLIIYIHVLSV